MPYKSEKINIQGTKYDRRMKLTPEQKEEIKRRYETENIGMRPLAKEYGVTRGLIRYIVYPEKLEKNRERQKKARAEGKYKYTKEKWAATQREHRKYKQDLYKSGKIKPKKQN